MRKAWLLAGLAAACGGCGRSESGPARLRTGDRAVVYVAESRVVRAIKVEGMIDVGTDWPIAEEGQDVLVLADESADPTRPVRVRMEGGPYRGKTGLIPRDNLRPIPK